MGERRRSLGFSLKVGMGLFSWWVSWESDGNLEAGVGLGTLQE